MSGGCANMLRIAYLRPKAWPFPKNSVVLGEECWLLSVLADLRTLFPMSLKAILLRKASASEGVAAWHTCDFCPNILCRQTTAKFVRATAFLTCRTLFSEIILIYLQ